MTATEMTAAMTTTTTTTTTTTIDAIVRSRQLHRRRRAPRGAIERVREEGARGEVSRGGRASRGRTSTASTRTFDRPLRPRSTAHGAVRDIAASRVLSLPDATSLAVTSCSGRNTERLTSRADNTKQKPKSSHPGQLSLTLARCRRRDDARRLAPGVPTFRGNESFCG
ncbi:hypothetical protein P5V15_006244 [Pogonomyrmex californicus]